MRERFRRRALSTATDVAALSSAWGEGFPNVLGEAMASGVRCVASAVGDGSWVVGRTASSCRRATARLWRTPSVG